MPCQNPQTLQREIEKLGSTFSYSVEHCADGYVVITGKFSPANQGRAVVVKTSIQCDGEGQKPLTKKVTFHDNGQITGYGDTSNGVRFRVKPFDYRRYHTVLPDAYFIQ